MENESLPKTSSASFREALNQQDEELVRTTARNAERLAIALGLPREAKYDVLAALGGSAVDAFTNLKETYGTKGTDVPPGSATDRPETEGE